MDRLYAFNHSGVSFYFKQSSSTFVVQEVPLYDFSGTGEHLVLHVRKKNLTTLELIEKIAKYLKIQRKEIGYAGLKDKNALTYQYISLHKKYEKQLEGFSQEGVKILSKTYYDNKIRMGHLKGNEFFIRLKKVNPTDGAKITQILENIKKSGMPNFFGYQRFGNDGQNYKEGELIAKGKKSLRDVKMRKFLVSAYQSHLFNLWLSKRLEIGRLIESFDIKELTSLLNMPKEELKELQKQKHPFKIMRGDLMQHYPYGRVFEVEQISSEYERFLSKDISPTGLLCGKRVKVASMSAREIEKSFDETIQADGQRRYAWVFPQNIKGEYKPQEAWYELHFFLPKGSYATVLLEEIAKKELKEKS